MKTVYEEIGMAWAKIGVVLEDPLHRLAKEIREKNPGLSEKLNSFFTSYEDIKKKFLPPKKR
jgi:hypothetical protein